MYVCIVSHNGAMLLHRTMQAAPAPFLQAVAPSRDGLVVAVAGNFTWYWLADFCAAAGLPCVRGHALDMKAMHGGKATNDQIDSQKLTALRRGGMLPPAEGHGAAVGVGGRESRPQGPESPRAKGSRLPWHWGDG
jgi:hypothetical protein